MDLQCAVLQELDGRGSSRDRKLSPTDLWLDRHRLLTVECL